MRRVAPLVAALLLSACASPDKPAVVNAPGVRLERGKSLLIATPKNGVFENKEYPLSGRQTAAVFRSAFARFSDKVDISSRCADLACLQSEGGGGYVYLVIPEILHWEDRNTEWSGIPDRVDVKLVVVDSRNNAEVASGVLSRKGSKLVKIGNGLPEDLLPELVQLHVQNLY